MPLLLLLLSAIKIFLLLTQSCSLWHLSFSLSLLFWRSALSFSSSPLLSLFIQSFFLFLSHSVYFSIFFLPRLFFFYLSYAFLNFSLLNFSFVFVLFLFILNSSLFSFFIKFLLRISLSIFLFFSFFAFCLLYSIFNINPTFFLCNNSLFLLVCILLKSLLVP